jgi:hypothetical protein
MKQRRLMWLLVVMGSLAIVRLLIPSQTKLEAPSVVEAIVRKQKRVATPAETGAGTMNSSKSLSDELDLPGDAFAVRPMPPPPYLPPTVVAKTVTKTKTRASPAFQSPPVAVDSVESLPVPFQVIGTWDDGEAPGVFLSSPYGTLLARPGATLQSEYRVTSIAPQQITLVQLSTQREVHLAVPRPPTTPRPYP